MGVSSSFLVPQTASFFRRISSPRRPVGFFFPIQCWLFERVGFSCSFLAMGLGLPRLRSWRFTFFPSLIPPSGKVAASFSHFSFFFPFSPPDHSWWLCCWDFKCSPLLPFFSELSLFPQDEAIVGFFLFNLHFRGFRWLFMLG